MRVLLSITRGIYAGPCELGQSRDRYNLCSMSPRKDGNGRPLEILLAYVLDDVGAQDIQRALGVSAATYYRRKQQEDYPSADELLLVAHYFDMNPVSLLLSFGLIDEEDTPSAGPVVPPLAVVTKREVKAKPRKKTPRLRGSSRF
jgi:hypothetical protein